MDPTHFDRLTRSLWQPHSRRHILGALALRLGGAPPVTAAPPAHRRSASTAKRRCRAHHGRYFGPKDACPCGALCPVGVNYSHYPCPIAPDCVCFPSATGGAICASGVFDDNPTGCATNADCVRMYGNDYPLCILTPCKHSDGAPCGPGQPPCTAGQACLNGRCRTTGCVTACG